MTGDFFGEFAVDGHYKFKTSLSEICDMIASLGKEQRKRV